jgi:hypothetical protein
MAGRVTSASRKPGLSDERLENSAREMLGQPKI